MSCICYFTSWFIVWFWFLSWTLLVLIYIDRMPYALCWTNKHDKAGYVKPIAVTTHHTDNSAIGLTLHMSSGKQKIWRIEWGVNTKYKYNNKEVIGCKISIFSWYIIYRCKSICIYILYCVFYLICFNSLLLWEGYLISGVLHIIYNDSPLY